MNSSANAYLPDRVSLPGETLQEILEDRQMTQAELAERTGRPKKTINEIIKGKSAITPETALQLERVLGVPASFWNNLEQNYQDYLARRNEDRRLEASLGWLEQIPVAELIGRGWIDQCRRRVDQARAVLEFFGVASPDRWQELFVLPQASFRRSPSFKSEAGALSAWLRKGEIEARQLRCAPFEEARFKEVLAEVRVLTREAPGVATSKTIELCAAAGVAVVFVPELPRCRVHGATRWLSSNKALVQMSLRYKTDDHLWFTFFHEAGHILLHGKKKTFIDVEVTGASEAEELEANQFAADWLIPPDQLAELEPGPLSKERVLDLAQGLGISPGIVVGRLQHLGRLPYSHLNGLKKRLDWDAGFAV